MHEQLQLLGLLALDEQGRPERHSGRGPELIQRSTRSDAGGEVFDPQELLQAAQRGAPRPPDPRLGFVEVIGGGVAIPFVQTDPGQREVGVGQPVMVGDAVRFGEGQRGGRMGSGLRTSPGEGERERMPTKREDSSTAGTGRPACRERLRMLGRCRRARPREAGPSLAWMRPGTRRCRVRRCPRSRSRPRRSGEARWLHRRRGAPRWRGGRSAPGTCRARRPPRFRRRRGRCVAEVDDRSPPRPRCRARRVARRGG